MEYGVACMFEILVNYLFCGIKCLGMDRKDGRREGGTESERVFQCKNLKAAILLLGRWIPKPYITTLECKTLE